MRPLYLAILSLVGLLVLASAPPSSAFTVEEAVPSGLGGLPERDGVVSWTVLGESQVDWVLSGEFEVPEPTFAPSVISLNGSTLRLQGYGFPLEADLRSSEFLLVPYSLDCPFCAAGVLDVNQMVLVQAEEAQLLDDQAMVLEGTFELVEDDAMGVIYRLNNAKPVD